MIADHPGLSIQSRGTPDSPAMAFPRYPSSRRSDDVQLPIVLIPDVDDDTMDSESELEFDTGKGQEEPQPSSAPQHPIPSMQQAFAESLVEATHGDAAPKPKLRTGDAKARREELLDQADSDPPPTALWRRRTGQKMHELCRLMAQISFGVYLLLNGMANSQILVVSILQGHIDEVDEFLETTLEDMDLATRDMEERIKHLKLPMDNMVVFERMLEDRNFRFQILEGNKKIEHILARSQVALKQTMEDLAEGLGATREFTVYLSEQQYGSWRQERPDVIDIFDAMKGNTDGWFNAFVELQAKGSSLNALITRLTDIVSEMERRAGQFSLKSRFSIAPLASPRHSPRPSDASSVTTPPSSPRRNIPNSPPRLSLRLSTLKTVDMSLNGGIQLAVAQEIPYEESEDGATPRSMLMVTSKSPPPDSPPESPPESPPDSRPDSSLDSSPESPPRSPPARNPRRLSERPATLLDLPKLEVPKDNEDEDTTLYMLQPRTYTPLLPSPQPSPRIIDERRNTRAEAPKQRPASAASSVESAAQLRIEHAKPRVEQIVVKPQAQKLRVVEIGSRTDLRPPPRRSPGPDPAQAPEVVVAQGLEVVVPQGLEVAPRQRTSLRQRISLKTNPPEAIQVPTIHNLEMQRQQHPVRRGYQAPDSAYVSDLDRQAVNSMASINSSLADFTPPFVQPGMIPSPHSERQFFRPVQASPYSPLQQRPHTSGTVGPHHFPAPPPPRNIPSAMGRSMMSSASIMTSQTASGKLKKKRSAFGWLKKAFSLDEEEKAAFEQKRREESANRYYEPKSPQFLDGRRIRQRPAY